MKAFCSVSAFAVSVCLATAAHSGMTSSCEASYSCFATPCLLKRQIAFEAEWPSACIDPTSLVFSMSLDS